MVGDIAYPLAVNPHLPPIIQAIQILLACERNAGAAMDASQVVKHLLVFCDRVAGPVLLPGRWTGERLLQKS